MFRRTIYFHPWPTCFSPPKHGRTTPWIPKWFTLALLQLEFEVFSWGNINTCRCGFAQDAWKKYKSKISQMVDLMVFLTRGNYKVKSPRKKKKTHPSILHLCLLSQHLNKSKLLSGNWSWTDLFCCSHQTKEVYVKWFYFKRKSFACGGSHDMSGCFFVAFLFW